MLIESLFTAFPRAAYSREWNIFPQTSQLNPAIRAFPRPRHRGPACGGISGHGEKRCSSLPAGTCSFGLASERTPFVRPPHQLKVFEEEGEGFGEREGELSPESSLPFPNLKFSPHSQSFSLKSVMRLALEKVRGSAPGSTISTLMRAMMRLCISSPMARAIPASLPEPTPD